MSKVYVVMQISYNSDGNTNISITGVWGSSDRAEAGALETISGYKNSTMYSNVLVDRIEQDHSTIRYDMKGRSHMGHLPQIDRVLFTWAIVETKWCLSPLEELAAQA